VQSFLLLPLPLSPEGTLSPLPFGQAEELQDVQSQVLRDSKAVGQSIQVYEGAVLAFPDSRSLGTARVKWLQRQLYR